MKSFSLVVAALSAMVDLVAKIQVILFTYRSRVVEQENNLLNQGKSHSS